MNITELKEEVNKLNLIGLYPNIHGYSLTFKERNGVVTDELCVQFYLEEKKEINDLEPSEVLPTSLNHLGLDIITDVKQAFKNYHLGINSDSYNATAVDYFNEPDFKTTDPIRLNYLKNRPLLGGSSSIYISGTDATLGLLVVDSTDDSIVALSNSHVYAASQFAGKLAALSGNFANTLALSARQPGTYLYGPYSSEDPQNDCIGKHKRCVPLTLTNNLVDSAVVQLTGYSLISPLSTQVNGFNFTGPYEFATTQEIDSLLDPTSPNFQAPIFRNGRTLGPIGFPGNKYTKTHLYSISDIPIKEIPLNNIEQIKINEVDGSWVVPDYVLTVKTAGKHYWGGNNNYYIDPSISFHSYFPAICAKNELTYLGQFDHLAVVQNATVGLSSNRLVYWGTGMYNVLSANKPINIDGNSYKPLPDNLQLNDFTGLSSLVTLGAASTYESAFLLKGNELYSIGRNGQSGSIGVGVSGDRVNSWTRVPGTWKSISKVNTGGLLALSTSGDMFMTTISGGSNIYPVFTNCFDLTANNLNFGKFVSANSNIASDIYTLSTNNTITKIVKYAYSTSTRTFNSQIYGKEWGSSIKLIGGHLSVKDPLILSGTQVYNINSSSTVFTTDFFSGAIKNSTYNAIPGINVTDIDGWSRNDYSIWSDMGNGEAIAYLSGGKGFVGGKNLNNMFATALSGRDDIITTSIGYNTNVTGYDKTDDAPIPFTDCLQIGSRDGTFPVTKGGDSGTAVFALLSSNIPALSTWKCIGLVFAGPTPTNTAKGVVCRIDNIVNQLKIKPWNGAIPTTKSKITNITYSSTLTAIPTITLSGREFYNIGIA